MSLAEPTIIFTRVSIFWPAVSIRAFGWWWGFDFDLLPAKFLYRVRAQS